MPKLILSVDDKIIEEYSIDKNTITIGRRIDNDVCLDNLAISGYHSQITTVSHDCFLEDLNSTNGTFVNSKIVKKHPLKDGDMIDIGNHRIKYINHLATNSANSNFEKTVVMSPESSQDKFNASIADLVDQIDAIAVADYVSNDVKTIDELEKLDDDLISDDSEEFSHSLETLANSETLDDNDNIGPVESMDNVEAQDPSSEKPSENVNKDVSEPNHEIENSDSVTPANPVETTINTELPEHKDVFDPTETMDDIEDLDSISNLDPVETMIGMESSDQHEAINVEQTSSSEEKINSNAENNDGRIQILNGSNSGKELILDKSLTTIGKPGVAVVGVIKRSSGYYIMQTEGDEEHPAKLNNEVIEGKARKLEAQDIIDVADIKLEYYID